MDAFGIINSNHYRIRTTHTGKIELNNAIGSLLERRINSIKLFENKIKIKNNNRKRSL